LFYCLEQSQLDVLIASFVKEVFLSKTVLM